MNTQKDRNAAIDTSQQPAFVLVTPQMGENIGAAARAMWNFGLARMRLVDPRDGWPNARATAMASGAGGILDRAGVFAQTTGAIADCAHVYATTARVRGITKDVLTPEEAMRDARSRIGRGETVAVLFGPERAGLINEDVIRANTIVSVPVNPAFASLNLAQCVLLMAYEWRRGGEDAEPPAPPEDPPATAVEMARLVEKYEDALGEAGFFWPEGKGPAMRAKLRNLFSRLPLAGTDVRILHGMLRALTGRRQR